mmetsp:Transcript_33998/g.81744  ORF Transcript_33998/g.81744 Transcript_33998/m.81744 type:complete len:99 (+) Transcript_33998:768-1064(+)
MECPDGDKRREHPPSSGHVAVVAVAARAASSLFVLLTTGRRFRRGGGTGLDDRLGILGAPSNDDVTDKEEEELPDTMGDLDRVEDDDGELTEQFELRE